MLTWFFSKSAPWRFMWRIVLCKAMKLSNKTTRLRVKHAFNPLCLFWGRKPKFLCNSSSKTWIEVCLVNIFFLLHYFKFSFPPLSVSLLVSLLTLGLLIILQFSNLLVYITTSRVIVIFLFSVHFKLQIKCYLILCYLKVILLRHYFPN